MTDTSDNRVNPETGEIADAGIRTFLIPVSKFKKHYLQVPQELADTLGSRLEKEPLSVYDSDKKKEF